MGFYDSFTYESSKKFDVADGTHSATITQCVERTAKSGKRMVIVIMKVDGANGLEYVHNIVEGDYFNRLMSNLYRCFLTDSKKIPLTEFIGKTGNVTFIHKDSEFTDANGVHHKALNAEISRFEPNPEFKESVVPVNPNVPQFSALQENTQPTLGSDFPIC